MQQDQLDSTTSTDDHALQARDLALAQLKEAEEDLAVAKEYEAELERENEDLKTENSRLTRESKDLKAKISTVQSDANVTINSLQQELERLRASDAEHRASIRSLEIENEQLAQAARAAEAAATHALERAAFVEDQGEGRRELEAELQRVKDQLRDATEELAIRPGRSGSAAGSDGAADSGDAAGAPASGGTSLLRQTLSSLRTRLLGASADDGSVDHNAIDSRRSEQEKAIAARMARRDELLKTAGIENRHSMDALVARAQDLEKRMAEARAQYATLCAAQNKTPDFTAVKMAGPEWEGAGAPASDTLSPPLPQDTTNSRKRAAAPPSDAGTTIISDSPIPDDEDDSELEEDGFGDHHADDMDVDDVRVADDHADDHSATAMDVDVVAPEVVVSSAPPSEAAAGEASVAEMEVAPASNVDSLSHESPASPPQVMEPDASTDTVPHAELLSPEAAVVSPQKEADSNLSIQDVDAAQDRGAMEIAPHTDAELLSPEAAVASPEKGADTGLSIADVDAAQDRGATEIAPHTDAELLSPEAAVASPEREANTGLSIADVDAAQDRGAMETAPHTDAELLSPEAAVLSPQKEADTDLSIRDVDAAQDRAALDETF